MADRSGYYERHHRFGEYLQYWRHHQHYGRRSFGTLFQVTGNGAITPTLASISDTSVMTTTGKLLDLTANAATTIPAF